MFRRGWSASVIVWPWCHRVWPIAGQDRRRCQPGRPADRGGGRLFVSDDGTKTFAGYTDAAGKFTMRSGDKVGIPAGTYKVTVQKSAKPGGRVDTPGSATI